MYMSANKEDKSQLPSSTFDISGASCYIRYIRRINLHSMYQAHLKKEGRRQGGLAGSGNDNMLITYFRSIMVC